jgi:hypothetical protein
VEAPAAAAVSQQPAHKPFRPYLISILYMHYAPHTAGFSPFLKNLFFFAFSGHPYLHFCFFNKKC